MRLFFLLTLVASMSACQPDDEVSVLGPIAMNTDSEYFVEYDKGGQNYHYPINEVYSTQISMSGETSWTPWVAAWTRCYFNEPNYNDYLYFAVALPPDSSALPLGEINSEYPINGSIGATWHSPGTVIYTKNTATGSDQELNGPDSKDSFNRITNIQYVGNRYYDQFYQVVLCEYLIEGEFKITVQNDVTGIQEVLENGKYKYKVKFVAV